MVMSFDEMMLKAKEFSTKNNKINEVITPNIKELKDKTSKTADGMVEFKSIVDKLVKVIVSDRLLSDENLDLICEIYDDFELGRTYTKGTIIVFNGNIYEVIEAVTSNSMYLPDVTPTQYVRLNKSVEIIDDIIEEPIVEEEIPITIVP